MRHVSISDKVLDDDAKNEIFIPGVRKLEINFKADSKCQTPVGVTFGGDELQELDIQCNQNDRNYEYFSTLYRYPNIKTLNAGFNLTDHDLLKMAGKFPLLTKANFTLVYDLYSHGGSDITGIVKFVEQCDQLEEINLHFTFARDTDKQEWIMYTDLKKRISDRFKIIYYLNKPMRIERNTRNKSNSKFVTSGLVCFLIVIHICHALLR